MDYQRIYNELIADRRINQPSADEYVEVHHILPRCMGGTDDKSNLIRLSPDDHFFSHLLLAKVHGGKLWFAVRIMAASALGKTGGRKSVRITPMTKTLRRRYARVRIEAVERTSGLNHPFSDKTSYVFENRDGRTFEGTRLEFRFAFDLDGRGIDNVMTGYAKSVEGWFIPDLLSNNELEKLRLGRLGAKTDKTVYSFKHHDGREYSGQRWQFSKYAGVSRTMTERLVNGGCHTASGWYLPSLNPEGIDGRYYCSGERTGTAIKTVYHFKHISGEEHIGTRMSLVDKYGLSRSAVHNMAKGTSATSGGWYMLTDIGKPMHADNDNIHMQSCMDLAA